MKREFRKIERTPEDKARIKAIRDKFQAEKPSLEDLVESGEYTEPVKHGVVLDAMRVAHLLKEARTSAELSVAEVSQRCGLDGADLSRLETGVFEDTTLATPSRLADCYGKQIVVDLVDNGAAVK